MATRASNCPFTKKHLGILKSLCLLPPAERRLLLRRMDRKLTRCICECAYNVLRGVVELSNDQKAQLTKHAKLLRRLARRGEKIEKKKTIIVQRGGGAFLPALLVPILSAILNKILE